MIARHNSFMLLLLRGGDLVASLTAWLLVHWLNYNFIALTGAPVPSGDYVVPVILSMILIPLIFGRMGLYEPRRIKSAWGEALRIVQAVVLSWVVLHATVQLIRPLMISRRVSVLYLCSWMILALAVRLAARIGLHQLRKRGFNLRHAAIIGTGRLGQRLYHALKKNPWTGVQVEYFLAAESGRDELLGKAVAGLADCVEDVLAERPVQMVFVALPDRHHELREKVINRLATTHVDVRVVPDMLSFYFLRQDMTQLDNLPIVSLTHTPLRGWNGAVKRIFDFVLAAFGLVLLSPLMLAVAAAIKLTGGPVFYRQLRTSLGGEPFKVIKFRSMIMDAEQGTGPVWATPDDPRVTPLGRFLRRTSLDELPQLINVLAGDMSLVGPRPERPELIEHFRRQIPRYMLRHHVKAGLTGWAQVHGLRGRTSLRKRIQYDMFYICNWSFGLDIRILLMTVLHVLGSGAY